MEKVLRLNHLTHFCCRAWTRSRQSGYLLEVSQKGPLLVGSQRGPIPEGSQRGPLPEGSDWGAPAARERTRPREGSLRAGMLQPSPRPMSLQEIQAESWVQAGLSGDSGRWQPTLPLTPQPPPSLPLSSPLPMSSPLAWILPPRSAESELCSGAEEGAEAGSGSLSMSAPTLLRSGLPPPPPSAPQGLPRLPWPEPLSEPQPPRQLPEPSPSEPALPPPEPPSELPGPPLSPPPVYAAAVAVSALAVLQPAGPSGGRGLAAKGGSGEGSGGGGGSRGRRLVVRTDQLEEQLTCSITQVKHQVLPGVKK